MIYDCYGKLWLFWFENINNFEKKKIEHVSFDICQNYINPIDYISTPF